MDIVMVPPIPHLIAVIISYAAVAQLGEQGTIFSVMIVTITAKINRLPRSLVRVQPAARFHLFYLFSINNYGTLTAIIFINILANPRNRYNRVLYRELAQKVRAVAL